MRVGVDDRSLVVGRDGRGGDEDQERGEDGAGETDRRQDDDFLKWAESFSIRIASASFSERPVAVTSCATAVATHSPPSFL